MNTYLSRLYGFLGLLIISAVLLAACGDSSGQNHSQASASSSAGGRAGGVGAMHATPTGTPATAPTVSSAPTQAATQSQPAPAPAQPIPTQTPTQVTYPNIAGSYSGSYTSKGSPATYPMQLQLSQSGPNLTGTTTEGSTVYNDTGSISTSGNFTITENYNGSPVAYLYGSSPSTNQLAGTWSNNSTGSGNWNVSK